MPRIALPLAIAALASGCGLLLDLDEAWDGGPGADAGPPDAHVERDADAERDAGDGDGDAGDGIDAGPANCAPDLDGDALAHYRFDGDATDSLGVGPAGIEVGPVAYETSSACGSALTFPSRDAPDTAFVELPADDFWRRPEGAIDLRVRVDALPTTGSGVLSRDATGGGPTDAGHLTLYVARTGQLAARIQGDTDDQGALCTSEPIPLGEWIHVGINFGPTAEMFVDGLRADFVGPLDSGESGNLFDCSGTLTDRPLDGNDEPWVIGASSWLSVNGEPTPLVGPLVGAIDDLRFWRAPVAFERP